MFRGALEPRGYPFHVCVQDLEDVFVVSSRECGQRAAIKFASYVNCSVASSSRWTPGSLTNHQTKNFKEPKILLAVDPFADAKPIVEASYANIPVIALCDTNNSLKYVDIAIPCNNFSTQSISIVMWLIAREVLMLRGKLDLSDDNWEGVMVDLFYQKDLNAAKNEAEEEEKEDEDGEEGADDNDEDSENFMTSNN